MRAFSLYFDVLPVIVVNGADWARGRLFSLLHEYAHLLLHSEGLCDMVTDTKATTPDAQLEARCNAIAASILMPRDLVLASPLVQQRTTAPASWDYTSLTEAAPPSASARRRSCAGWSPSGASAPPSTARGARSSSPPTRRRRGVTGPPAGASTGTRRVISARATCGWWPTRGADG